MFVGVAAALATTLSAAAVNPSAASGTDWPVYHGDLLGSGVAGGPASSHGLQKAWTSAPLGGQIYGEPLVDGSEVVVATENDVVYALDASNNGRVLWSTTVGTAVPSRRLPCGDIRPRVGITSTPVIDEARSEVFVVADELAGAVISHHAVGLSLSTGAVLLDQVVDPSGSDPAAQLQRAALTLADGNVVIGFGGNDGDCSTYHGWVVAVPEAGGAASTFEVDPSPGNDEGAVWMGGAAPVVDGGGNIWVATGNGSVPSATPDGSDSVVELSPTLHVVQSFTPSTWATDNDDDADLGSSPPALLPDGLVFELGKSQSAYLLSQSTLGGVGGQQAELDSVCSSFGGNAFNGTAVYVPCSSGLAAVQVSASPPSMTVLWTSSASGPPIVAGGVVWTINHRRGTLFGLDPQSGTTVVRKRLGSIANHFPTPAFGDGLLLAADSHRVHAFSLVP